VITTAIRLARVGSPAELAAALLLGLGYCAALFAALAPHVPLFAAAAATTYTADWYLHHRHSYLVNRLGKIRAGIAVRFLLRQLLLIVLLAREDLAHTPLFPTAVAGFLLLHALHAPHSALTTLIRMRRTLPVVTRNIDLHKIRVPDAPPRALLSRSTRKLLHLDLPAMAGILTAATTGNPLPGHAGTALTTGCALLYTAALVPCLLGRRVPPAATVLTAVGAWLREYRPTVVLYFSGSAEAAYQVNMWLRTMEHLGARPLVLMRERELMTRLEPTALPVLCVPGGTHLMNLDLSTVRVALYPANVGKNIHLLRVPTMKHVFIGHGDSDKLASVNPFSKVYDQVWTAGRAGRDRYALADVGVADDDVVEVGRPQLAPIETAAGHPRRPVPTVLYAPTWEGWDNSPGNTSLLLAGETLVRRLLAADPPVRLLYRPHPFTGVRDRRARAAHDRIAALVRAAAEARRAGPGLHAEDAGAAAGRLAAGAERDRIDAELAVLTAAGRPGGDEAEESRVSVCDPVRLDRIARLRTARNEAHWRASAPWEHQVVTGGGAPALHDCFNEADALVSDISSVVSDFLASGKPYAVTDSAGLGADAFRHRYTAARAAYVVSGGADGLEDLLAAVRSPSADPLAAARRDLKEYLLGPDRPSSPERFAEAVRTLAAAAEARNLSATTHPTPPLLPAPTQGTKPAPPASSASPVRPGGGA
jgi:hypothetical protein